MGEKLKLSLYVPCAACCWQLNMCVEICMPTTRCCCCSFWCVCAPTSLVPIVWRFCSGSASAFPVVSLWPKFSTNTRAMRTQNLQHPALNLHTIVRERQRPWVCACSTAPETGFSRRPAGASLCLLCVWTRACREIENKRVEKLQQFFADKRSSSLRARWVSLAHCLHFDTVPNLKWRNVCCRNKYANMATSYT